MLLLLPFLARNPRVEGSCDLTLSKSFFNVYFLIECRVPAGGQISVVFEG